MANNIESKRLQKVLKYVNKLRDGYKPSFSAEPIRMLSGFLEILEVASSRKSIRLETGLVTESGNVNINLIDDCGHIFAHLFPVIFHKYSDQNLDQYLKVTKKAISSKHVSNSVKTQIIDFENSNFKEIIDAGFVYSPYGFDSLCARVEVCRLGLSTPNSEIFAEKSGIKGVYSHYISKLVASFVSCGQLLQGADYLRTLLESAKSNSEIELLVRLVISHETSFCLRSKADLHDLLDEFEEQYSDDEIGYMRSEIDVDPTSIHLGFMSMSNGELSLRTTRSRNIITILSFSIPNHCLNVGHSHLIINDKIKIGFYPVSAFWADPMFDALKNWKIANMGWSHFCEIESEEGSSYTHIQISMDELYIPDLELSEEKNKQILFEEQEAIMGRPYYPHKEFAVKTILSNFEDVSKYIKIDKPDININMFSNYNVSHIDRETGECIHSKVYAITNPDSFSKTTTRFVDRINSVNLSDSLIDIRELLNNTAIENERNLSDFVRCSFEVIVKHNIENHGGYKYFWKNKDGGGVFPCREPEVQPYIFSLLRAVYDFMGIQISREVESSNGEIDFLVSYTNSQGKLLRVCVELKLAHARGVENGLLKQLQAYMKGERCKHGGFIALWYKGDSFDEPKKYNSVSEFEERINHINGNRKVFSMVVDCTKPTSPSKLK